MKAGKLRAGGHRQPALAGDARRFPPSRNPACPGYEVYEWNAVFVPAGVPQDVIGRLQRELVKIVAMPDVRESWRRSVPSRWVARLQS